MSDNDRPQKIFKELLNRISANCFNAPPCSTEETIARTCSSCLAKEIYEAKIIDENLVEILITALFGLGDKVSLNFVDIGVPVEDKEDEKFRDDWWDMSANKGGSQAIAELLVKLGLWEHKKSLLKHMYRPIQHRFQECED